MTSGFYPHGAKPEGGTDPADSKAVVLPYADALEDPAAELVFVVAITLTVPQSA